VIVLGLDSATPATAVALLDDARPGAATERRHEPAPGQRPGHASQLLRLAAELLDEAGLTFAAVDRIAVGLGPGTFTGLRIGVATARALAQSTGAELVGVSTLRALAAEAQALAPAGTGVLAVIDARRGEVFAAAWQGAEPLLEAVAIAPEDLAAKLGAGRLAGPLAAGDGAVRFREQLERAGALVPDDRSPAHLLSALQVCRLGAAGDVTDRDRLVPDYRREPDAKPRQDA
jgi:tRNA threonylcarbamoyladenosine biosynthesis protein TsaB